MEQEARSTSVNEPHPSSSGRSLAVRHSVWDRAYGSSILSAPTILAAWIATGLIVMACGGNPAGPDPLPTPTPTPVATPTPPPPMRPFEPGMIPALRGATTCCDDPNTAIDEGIASGWPFVDERTLDIYRAAGINLTEVRVGPVVGNGGDPGPEESLLRLDATLTLAEERGIYVLVGLFDIWPTKYGLSYWGEGTDVARSAPRAHHIAWVHQVIAVAKRHRNALIFDGNETFVANPRAAWVNGLFEAARDAGWDGPLGSNARLGLGDYRVEHGFRTVSSNAILAESDNRDHSVEEWSALRAQSAGAVIFWRGPMSWTDWVHLLGVQ